MLTEEELREIRAELDRAETAQSACVEGLKIVQGHRGYVSDEAIRDLASLFGLTPDELDSIATFYTFVFRRPVGSHLIFMCDGVSCWVMGYEQIFQYLKDTLGIGFGQTTPDEKFTLLPVSCIGACDKAPALILDGKLYGNLDIPGIERIIKGCD